MINPIVPSIPLGYCYKKYKRKVEDISKVDNSGRRWYNNTEGAFYG